MTAGRWRAWLVAGAIFILGAAVGAAGMAWVGVRVVRRALRAPVSAVGPADRAAARIGAQLQEELALTPEQAARVQAILNQSAANLKAVRARAAREAGAELRASTALIAAELPPEKRAEFYRIIVRRFDRLGLRPAAETE